MLRVNNLFGFGFAADGKVNPVGTTLTGLSASAFSNGGDVTTMQAYINTQPSDGITSNQFAVTDGTDQFTVTNAALLTGQTWKCTAGTANNNGFGGTSSITGISLLRTV